MATETAFADLSRRIGIVAITPPTLRRHALRLGILLPTRGILLKRESPLDLTTLFDLAQQAEDAGLDSVWVGDSLLSKPRLEPLSTLAAVAMRTHTVKLGTAVLLAPLRQPTQIAQMAATVDVLSGGRLTLGMGVGGAFTESQKREWLAVGVLPEERGRRMTELVQVCRRLWTEVGVTFSGRYFQLDKATLDPRPIQRGGIPMLLACHHATGSEPQYRRAACYADGVIGISDTPEQFAGIIRRVRRYAVEAGRDASSLRAAFYMTVNVNEDRDAASREADDFVQRYYGLNFWVDKWGPFGGPVDVIRRILEYQDAGAQDIIVRFASLDPLPQMRAFVQKVLPGVREGTRIQQAG